jgi:hypothetical protein
MSNKKIIRGLTLADYEKFAVSTTSRVNSLDDLFKFGVFPKERWDRYKVDDHAVVPWIGQAEEKVVKKDDWKYVINRYNFRDIWNLGSDKENIGFFGCSFTFGEGIKTEDTFPYVVSKQFNLNGFNFGAGGSSIQRVARTFSAVTKLIDLKYAVITLPHWHRQMYIDDTGKIINLIPHWPHEKFEDLNEKLTDLDEEYYVVQAASFITWMADIAELKGIKLIFSSWDYPLNDLCKVMYPSITINPFPNIDDKCARDKLHPGILSQQSHAEQIIKAINDRAWIQK